ncbi:hypothetical protein DICVIV_01418 [Dictyocaulus viviparus]|uniref:Phospholipase A2 n=1 Tax=Dictyocaulus viviparus TaxID=29172 RepID=A0A0D8YCX7_DICVI|nr:hypothetical protein DICVIV_01418 [Dictyocaulus viviparus]
MRTAVLSTVAFAVLMTSVLTSSSSDESYDEDDDTWQCGTDPISKYMKVINQCCIQHDSCYDDQKGRKYCDDTFCSCLSNVTRGSDVCNKEDGPIFCGLVQKFGAEPYRLSANKTDQEVNSLINGTQTLLKHNNHHKSSTSDYNKKLETTSFRKNDTMDRNLHQTSLLKTILTPHHL